MFNKKMHFLQNEKNSFSLENVNKCNLFKITGAENITYLIELNENENCYISIVNFSYIDIYIYLCVFWSIL